MSEYMKNTLKKEQFAEDYQATDKHDKLIINLRDLNHIMHSLYEGKASQKRILIILSKVKSITQRELTARLGIQPGSASEILSKLENAGLILRTESERDRRTADISLTDQGRQKAEEAAVQRRERHTEMFSCLSESEKDELLLLLEKVNEDWKRRYGEVRGHDPKHHPHPHKCGHRHGRREGYMEREDGSGWENM